MLALELKEQFLPVRQKRCEEELKGSDLLEERDDVKHLLNAVLVALQEHCVRLRCKLGLGFRDAAAAEYASENTKPVVDPIVL